MQLAIGSANDRSRVEKIYRSFHVCGTVFVRSEKTKKKKKEECSKLSLVLTLPRRPVWTTSSRAIVTVREKRLKEV